LPDGRLRQRAHNLATRRSAAATWFHAHSVFRRDQVRQMLGLGGRPAAYDEQIEQMLSGLDGDFRHESPIGLACLLDARLYMGNQLLRDSDVMSMASSLELRTPLVDVEIARFSRSCRDEFKLQTDGAGDGRYAESGAKRVLIQALRDVLP